MSVKEINGKIVFLRKLARGGSEHSFGIHVAKLAGMPRSIVSRASTVLKKLEESNREENKERIERTLGQLGESTPGVQLSFFQLDDPVLTLVRNQILEIDIDNLTPMAALNKLHDIKSILTGK